MGNLMMRAVAVGMFLIMFGVTASAMAQDDDTWTTYANPRFGYSICYPPDILSAQPESDDGDGRVFVAEDGTKLTVYARYNASSQSLKQAAEEDGAALAGKDGHVTYRSGKEDWSVLSGTSGDTIFYQKTLSIDNATEFDAFNIVYNAKQAKIYGPIVDRLAKCFAHTGHVGG